MKEKFTYFDFLAYFIPGTVLIWVCMMVLRSLEITDLKTQNVITDSLIFVVLAFVVGHLIQFRSKQKTENTIKNKYWSGSFVSNLFLVKGNRFCPEYDRQRYIQILQEHLGLKTTDTQELENPDNDNAKIISQSMYRKCLTLIEDKNIGIKAIKANEYYNFFRGLSTTCVYSCFISAITFIYMSVRFFKDEFSYNIPYILGFFLLAVLFGYASYAFRARASQRGELHVSEVFRSVEAYYSK